MARKTIKVDSLARVEGDGGLQVIMRNGALESAQLRIFEPPRFFEALLRGRHFSEAPDITARICGICPVAYQMSAIHAMENALGVQIDGAVRELRRLLYCGEWISSHVLHIVMLHAPDFLGCQSAIELAREHAPLLQQGLELKKVGNQIVAVLAGRAIHPINVRIGGFYRVPTKNEVRELRAPVTAAREAALELVRWSATLPYPDFERDYTFVALRHPQEYPLNSGRIVSNRGLDITADEYESCFEECQVHHSSALHCHLDGATYLTGPLARYTLNSDRLSPIAREAAASAGLGPVCRNPYRSIMVRCIEVLYACDEALRIITAYEPPPRCTVPLEPRAARACAATEAPRGLLYHRYTLDGDGIIQAARIVAPTSQNQGSIEADLAEFLRGHLSLPQFELRQHCEHLVRNHDPCISCAAHFLKLEVLSR
jgi:coenzyme F420-reducing hydrogenase alpha subunit